MSSNNILINFASPETQKSSQFDFYGGELNIWIWSNPKYLSMDKYFSGGAAPNIFQDPDGPVKSKNIIIDTRDGRRLYDVVGEGVDQIAVIDDHSRFIEIDDSTDILDRVLSTFKFTR